MFKENTCKKTGTYRKWPSNLKQNEMELGEMENTINTIKDLDGLG